MKQTIKLTEGDLHRIIRNCVNEAVSTINDPNLKKELNLDSEEEYEEYEDGGHHYKNKFVDIKHSKSYIDAITEVTLFGMNAVDDFLKKFQMHSQQLNSKEKMQMEKLICDGWAGTGDMFDQLRRFREWMANCYDEVNDVINFYS